MTERREDTPVRGDLLTVVEFAAKVRQHENTIYRRIREGHQPGAIRVGPRDIRIDLAIALPGRPR